MTKRKKCKRTNNDLQNIYKTNDRVTRTPLKTRGELRCSRRVGSSCSTSGTRRVNLVTNPVISHRWGKNREVLLKKNEKKLARSFNFTFLYIDDILSLNNSRFGGFVDCIYPIDLEIKDITDTDRSASYLHLEIDSEGRLRTKLYDKRDDFPLWTFHLYVATFQLHMEYISLRWYDIPELVVPIRISLIEGYC